MVSKVVPFFLYSGSKYMDHGIFDINNKGGTLTFDQKYFQLAKKLQKKV